MPSSTDLEGRYALITGSATGLGASIALGLAEKGAHILVNYSKSQKEAEETADKIRSLGAGVDIVQADVGSDEGCTNLAAAVSKYPRLDILANNAGTTKHVPNHADMDSLDWDDFAWIYRLNTIAPFMVLRAVRDKLEQTHNDMDRAAAVLNVSSIAGVQGIGSSVAYAASKGALNTMTLSLARALAPKIRVNAICPGFIETRWFSDQYGAEATEKIADNMRMTTPLEAASNADDIAATAIPFLTDATRHVTGETLLADAGLHMGHNPKAAGMRP